MAVSFMRKESMFLNDKMTYILNKKRVNSLNDREACILKLKNDCEVA